MNISRLLFAAAVTMTAVRAGAQAMTVDGLTVDQLVAPLAIDNTHPHFSWLNHASYNNARQTAYELQVGTDSVRLLQGHADCWHVGRHLSTSVMVPYEGETLNDGRLYYWRVRTWNDKGQPSAWSKVQRFGIGLNGPSAFHGQYIGLPASAGDNGAPMLRKVVRLAPKPGQRMLLHVNSLGYHEAYINGHKVSAAVLQPAVSQLDKRSHIVTYDVTALVRPGDNTVMLWLGRGWYRRNLHFATHDGPLVRADLCAVTPRGYTTVCCTDATWQGTPGAWHDTGTWQALHFGGERVDGRVLYAPQHKWTPVEVARPGALMASPQMCEPNSIISTLQPRRVQRQDDGSWLVDFGRVATAWLSLTMRGLREGQEVQMQYADDLDPVKGFQGQGESDSYVAAGVKEEHFQNKFHHHAFRYVRLTGLEQLQAADIKALQLSGGYTEASSFSCSDADINAIHDMMARTMRCLTFSGYMVDCPHLERMGYGGDGNSSTPTVQTFCQVAPTFYNWLQAWADAMGPDGNLPYVAPAGGGGGGAYWSAFMVKAPWRTYMRYADARALHLYYGQMRQWMQYAQGFVKEGLLQPWPDDERRMWFLGDWLAPAGVDVGGESAQLTNNCVLSDCLGTMARIALVLGHDDDARRYRSCRDTLNTNIHKAFFHEADTTYATGSPLDMAYALLVGAVPQHLRQAVAQRLQHLARTRYRTHIAGGLVGTAIFAQWAVQEGAAQLVYDMLKQRDYPGYLYMIDHGATTTWEYWNGERSHVHNCYNGMGIWFYQALGGIRFNEEMPGGRLLTIAPQCPKGVTWAKASLRTPYGVVRTHWNGETLKLEVPVGAEAQVVWQGKTHRVGAGHWTF